MTPGSFSEGQDVTFPMRVFNVLHFFFFLRFRSFCVGSTSLSAVVTARAVTVGRE